jgi:hypothetical protein
MCAKIVVLVYKKLFLSRRNENEMEEQLSRSHALTPFCFILLFLTSAKNLWCRRSFLVCARRQRCISLVVYVCYGSECKKRLVKVSRFGRIRDELFVSSRDIKHEIQPTEQCALFQPASSTGSFRCQITKVEFLHAQRTVRKKTGAQIRNFVLHKVNSFFVWFTACVRNFHFLLEARIIGKYFSKERMLFSITSIFSNAKNMCVGK